MGVDEMKSQDTEIKVWLKFLSRFFLFFSLQFLCSLHPGQGSKLSKISGSDYLAECFGVFSEETGNSVKLHVHRLPP